MSVVRESDFATVLRGVEGVQGWLTDVQAQRLWDRASALAPPARIVEIGSYHGRSAIVLGSAARDGVEMIAIDPHAGNDRGPGQWTGTPEEGEADYRAFRANLERAGLDDAVRHVRLPSQEALNWIAGDVDLLYIDGAHRYRPARDDIRRWGERVRPGGTMLIHDSFSAVGVTLAIIRLLFLGGRARYEGRTGSLAEYVRADLTPRERVTNALKQTRDLPWFIRNLAVKVAVVLRLRPLARMLGRRSVEWPC